jgi:localization factor PodJL
MTAGAPRSARMVDPESREMAEDLARRAGMSLNEWLARLMADGPEDATSQDYFVQSTSYLDPPRGAHAPAADEVRRVADALERLSDRIESAESRQALAIAGIERSVREVIGRIDAGEREQMQVAARFEGVSQEIQSEQGRTADRLSKLELENEGPRSADAIRALESAVGKVAGQLFDTERRTREAFGQISARVERIDQTERATHGAIRELKGACGELDGRLARVEGGAGAAAQSVQAIADNLSARVDAVRDDLAQQLAAAAEARFDRIEQALAQMGEHVRAAEHRSAGALERMGHEVLEVAQNLNRRVTTVEHGSAEAAERVGAQVAKMASAMEERLARADGIQAQALEKLGGEIARITERLAERIAGAERRSAQAIDDVGEQVARVTERISQRHERSTSELSERIRQSEERTARLLEEARLKIDDRLAETQRRIAEAQARPEPAAPYLEPDPDDALFTDEPFPTYEAPPAAERTFARPAALYTPILGKPLGAPPAFDDTDFEAAAELVPPLPPLDEPEPAEDMFEPAAAATPMVAEAEPMAEVSTPDHELAATPIALVDERLETVELEPNVGFDLDDDELASATLAAATAPEAVDDASLEEIAPVAASPLHDAEDESTHATWDELDEEREPEHAVFAPQSLAAEAEPDAEGELPDEALFEPAKMVTARDVMDRARAAAPPDKNRLSRLRPAARQGGEGILEGLSFGRSRRQSGGGMTGALMVASLLAAVSLSAGGFLFLEGAPGGKLPKRVNDMLALVRGEAQARPVAATAAATPMAAMALAPTPIASPLGPQTAGAYAGAVAKIEAGQSAATADMRHLADQGYAPAQFYLSKLYEDGKGGLKKDPAAARAWAQKAAEAGDRAAMHNLALDYFEGVGGMRDAATAAEWFRRAADLGLLDSQFNLAGLYEHGDGVPANAAEAYKWYLIAAKAGDAESKAGAARVRAGLSPEARAVAERAAQAFQPTTPNPAAAAAAAPTPASPDLVTAQRALNQLGYYQGPTDGASSQALHLAIAAYQRDQGLPITGSPDPTTVGKLAVYTR